MTIRRESKPPIARRACKLPTSNEEIPFNTGDSRPLSIAKASTEQKDQEVIVTVRDNGIGIPPELQGRVFEMFAQIDRHLEKGYKGLGIGLTLVKRLVEMHQGRIDVHSAGAGQGAEFRVYLPIADRSSLSTPPRSWKHPLKKRRYASSWSMTTPTPPRCSA